MKISPTDCHHAFSTPTILRQFLIKPPAASCLALTSLHYLLAWPTNTPRDGKPDSKRLKSLALLGFALYFFLCTTAGITHAEVFSHDDELKLGKRIYLEGVLASGTPLQGTRFGNTPVSGASAACVNCHRRSGMGQVEGDIMVQPITGNFLFATQKDKQLATMDPRVSKFFNQAHDPYTDQTLEKAINHGINNLGREMNIAMPRYNLSPIEIKAVTTYLKQLSQHWSPGVSDTQISFGLVITPGVEPLRRKALVDMVQAIFRQKNGSTEVASQKHSRHHMTSAAEFVLGTERKWDLDIWELQGPPESWNEQLSTHYRNHPVFALVSGISNSTWQPVHDFCEREQVPCWFPSVALPALPQSEYSIYFNGGVRLEANVLARYLLAQKTPPRHLVQIYLNDDVGRAASEEMMHALAGSSITVSNLVLQTDQPAADSLRQALSKIDHNDNVMFWLPPDRVESLGKFKPASSNNFFSSVLARAENAPLPEEWKADSNLVYPYELPEKRALNLQYFRAWLNIRKLPLVDEVMQSEVYFALNFLTDTLAEMLDNLYRDYLIERAETMISKREGTKAEQETRDRVALGKEGDLSRRFGAMTADESIRIQIPSPSGDGHLSKGTTIYPHLSLGPGQRFASKGGYIVRFADSKSDKIIAESNWIVP